MLKNLNLIFDKNQILSILLISIFIIVSMILEGLSIGLIFPILSVTINSETESQNFFFNLLYEKLNFFGSDQKIEFFGLSFLALELQEFFIYGKSIKKHPSPLKIIFL